MVVQLERKRFTVTNFQQMVDAGILQEDDRCELLNGEIVNMSPIGRRHASKVNRLAQLFHEIARGTLIVSTQNPIELGPFSQPEPDIGLLRWQDDFYESGHPKAEDVYLLIEVADSTLETDRNIKLPLYAQTGIVEVWIVNLQDNVIEVYRQPIGAKYTVTQIFTSGQTLTIEALPEISIEVNHILG
jgi:Uma2 family endonuclease